MGQVVPNSGPYSAHAMHCYAHPCKAWPTNRPGVADRPRMTNGPDQLAGGG